MSSSIECDLSQFEILEIIHQGRSSTVRRGVLVLEDAGRTLAQDLAKQTPTLAATLGLVLPIARALQAIHAAGIVHGDLCPANISVGDEGGVRVGDFARALRAAEASIARGWVDEHRHALAYIAPEQTGRMNRAMDYRSDYYALGAIFFELLTGHPPFAATEPLELIHAHTAIKPSLVHDLASSVPRQLSLLVDKLLSKDPDQRYQGSFSLIADLERCIDALAEHGTVPEFALATADSPEQFRLPPGLYGRDPEIARLRAALARVESGSPR